MDANGSEPPKKKSKKETATTASKQSTYVQSTELENVPQSTIDEYLKINSVQISDPSSEANLRPITSFDYLPAVDNGLYTPLKKFSKPTTIQSVAWPFLFASRDLIGVAETGSGKTLAFGLPCIQRVVDINARHSSSRVSAVIITPTRELAMQIRDQLVQYVPKGLGVACLYGGASKDEQRQSLKRASIVIATPGRLKDLQNDQPIVDKTRFLVLDEADRMLDKGFEQDIKDIIGAMPDSKKRQTVMFTATWPPAVRQLAESFMRSPVTVTIGGGLSSDLRANDRIKQIVEVVKPQDKESRLLSLLNQYQRGKNRTDRILVFCLYKKEAMRIERMIRSKGFNVGGIHGDLSQNERIKSLEAFKAGSVPLLIATDVAARGLDIPSVKLVLNVTFPLTVEDYVHRIGR